MIEKCSGVKSPAFASLSRTLKVHRMEISRTSMLNLYLITVFELHFTAVDHVTFRLSSVQNKQIFKIVSLNFKKNIKAYWGVLFCIYGSVLYVSLRVFTESFLFYKNWFLEMFMVCLSDLDRDLKSWFIYWIEGRQKQSQVG